MYKSEREDEILAILSENDYATVESLAQKMEISPSSIRRDLKSLEERGLVARSYGGVKPVHAGIRQFSPKNHENAQQKKRIAKAAISLVKEGDIVFLDGSDEAYFLAELLPTVNGLTVITNNLDAMSCFTGSDCKAYCTGGIPSSHNRSALVGGYAQSFVRQIRASIAFFSVDAISESGECFDKDPDQVAVRNAMLANAKAKVLLCDGDKLGRLATFYQTELKEIDRIICDRELNGFFTEEAPEKYIKA